jgi:hypothetical protein
MRGKDIVVGVGPFFESGIACSALPLPRRAAIRRDVPVSGFEGKGGKEELVSSVPTSSDPIPEADARKVSEVAPTETKSRDTEGDGATDVVKEATVPQVTSLPTPTTEASPGSVKDVTVGDEAAMNGMSATVVSDPLPPASEDDGCMSVDTASTKRSSSTGSEGFTTDVMWEERTWKALVTLKEDMFLARIGGIRALQG